MDALARINWLDMAIVLILIIGMMIGFASGALRQLLALAALYVSLIISANFSTPVANQIQSFQPTMVPAVAQVIAFFFLLFLTAIVLNLLLFDILRTRLQNRVNTTSRLLGGVLGLIGSAIFISVGLIAIGFMTTNVWPNSGEGLRQWLVEARIRSNIVSVFRQFFPLLVQSLRPWVPNLPALFNIDIQLPSA